MFGLPEDTGPILVDQVDFLRRGYEDNSSPDGLVSVFQRGPRMVEKVLDGPRTDDNSWDRLKRFTSSNTPMSPG
jgi:hypothetical protein